MNANESPEKIYLIRNISTPTSLNTTNDCHEKYLQEWYKEREKDADIEYTRTDIFIEKATEWIKENLLNYTYVYEGEVGIGMAVFLEDFRNYIKE